MARRVILSRTATASPTSGSFLTLADARESGPVILAKVTLRSRGASPALTLRFSDVDFTDSDGDHWLPVIYAKTELDAAGRYMDDSWQPVDFDLTIGDKRQWFQTLQTTLMSLLSEYEWTGSEVTVYQAFLTLTDPADWMVIFQGEVAAIEDMQPTEVTLACVQDRKWQVKFPPNTLTKNDYPDLPTDGAGLPAPILVGDWDTKRRLLDLTGSAQTNAAYAGIARGAFPMIAIDAAETASEAPEYFVSDEELETDYSNGYIVDSGANRLALSASATSTNPAGGPATLTLNDRTFYVCILGVSDHASSNTSTWNESSKEDKEYNLTGYDLLDNDAGEDTLQVWLPDVAPMGEWVGARVWIWFSKNASAAVPVFGIKNVAVPPVEDLENITTLATAGYPSDIPLASQSHAADISASAPTVLRTWSDIGNCTLYANVSGAGDELRIHRIGLIVQYKARQSIIKSRNWLEIEPRFGGDVDHRFNRERVRYTEPAAYTFNPSLLNFGTGVPDDGSGTYTGSADTLIEHPADFVHWLLVDKGSLTAAEITTASSTFGSFVDCRTDLSGYKMLAHYGRESTVNRIVRDVSNQFLIWFHRNNLADNQPWRAIPWDVGATVDYRAAATPFYFTPDNVEGVPRVRYTPVSGVRNVVRVNFDHDPRTNSFAEQVFVSPTDSRGWTGAAFARDQNAGAPDNRETVASTSVTAYGEKEETLNLTLCRDAATATSIRNRYFDLLYKPRVTVNFSTYLNAVDLERGRVIALGEAWDSIFPCPVLDSGGSWANAVFRVLRVTRKETAATLYNVEAIEV